MCDDCWLYGWLNGVSYTPSRVCDGRAVLSHSVVPGRGSVGRIWFRGSASLVNRCFISFLWRWDFLCGYWSHTLKESQFWTWSRFKGFCGVLTTYSIGYFLELLLFLLHLFWFQPHKKRKFKILCEQDKMGSLQAKIVCDWNSWEAARMRASLSHAAFGYYDALKSITCILTLLKLIDHLISQP